MSGIRVELDVDHRQIRGALAELAARGRSLQPAMRSIGEMMLRSTDDRFRDQVDPEGNRWQPISPAWKEQKRERKHLQDILQMRGRLRGSITYKAASDRVAVGSNVVYAAIHQLGGSIRQGARTQVLAFKGSENKPGKFMSRKAASRRKTAVTIRIASIQARTITMPARPYLGLSSQDRERVLTILMRHLEGGR